MTNLLILKTDTDPESVHCRTMWTHDLVIQETNDPGIYSVVKSRLDAGKARLTWPDVCRLLKRMEVEYCDTEVQ